VRILGWSSIPDGYGAIVDTERVPRWLHLWSRTPLLDRFCYPVLVKRGLLYLIPHPGTTPQRAPAVWTVRDHEK